jgi:copper chaperone
MQFHIPSIENFETADHLKAVLLTSEPDADIDIDVDQKTITVDSEASAETFRQLITAAGYKVNDAR